MLSGLLVYSDREVQLGSSCIGVGQGTQVSRVRFEKAVALGVSEYRLGLGFTRFRNYRIRVLLSAGNPTGDDSPPLTTPRGHPMSR